MGSLGPLLRPEFMWNWMQIIIFPSRWSLNLQLTLIVSRSAWVQSGLFPPSLLGLQLFIYTGIVIYCARSRSNGFSGGLSKRRKEETLFDVDPKRPEVRKGAAPYDIRIVFIVFGSL